MDKIKKAFLLCLSVVFCLILAMFATACTNSDANNSLSQSTDDEIFAIYNLYVADVTAKGNTPLDYEEWLETVRGQDGRGIASARINENGEFVINFTDGSYTNLGVIAPNDKYVTDISVVGNVISITFSDGTTAQYTTDGTTVCNHENLIYMEMVPHKMNLDGVTFTNGVYLELCPDCGRTTTVIGVIHNPIDTVVAPTCTEKGYTEPTCMVCGYVGEETDIVSALGHAFELRPLHTDENWCENGGIAIEICSRCNLAGEYRTISREEAYGHHSYGWKVSVEPTLDNVGTLTGMCYVCGNVVERGLPPFSNEAYVITNVTPENASCSATKKGTFTIEVDKQKIVIEDVAIPGSMHTLNGELVDDKETMIFDSVEDLINAGYKLMGNSEAFSCADYSNAYFTCDGCNEIVAINVKKSHVSADPTKNLIIKQPTCERDGIMEFDCVTCGNTVQETIPAVGHNYRYEVNDFGESYTITGICMNPENGIDCECSYVTYDNIRDAVMEVIREATCQQSGLGRYTLELANGEVVVIEVEIAKLDHVLEKADGTTQRISTSDGTRYYFPAYPEMTPFANAVVSCAADFSGQFTCAECHENIAVTLYMNHTPISDDKVSVVEPTCTEDGERTFTCLVCDEEVHEWLPYLGHDYDCTLKSDEDWDYVVIQCRRCDYTDTIQGRVAYYEIIILPICQQEGLKRVGFDSISGDREFFYVAIAKTSHTLNGKFIDDTKPVDGTMDGVKLFASANMGAVCSDGVPGYFTCDVCREVVSVTVVFPHLKPATISEDEIVHATCEKNGQIKYTCERCGENVCEVIPCLEHEIKPSATYNGSDVIIDIVCAREGCDFSDTVRLGNVHFDEGYYNDYKNFRFIKVIRDRGATCADEGCRGYSFGIDYAYETDKGTVKVVLDCYVELVIGKLAHSFVLTPALDEDGNPIFSNGYPVMENKIFTIEVVEDGMTYLVRYKLCADCGTPIMEEKILIAY